jgi:mevalonate pyrophosphate decarboxylase
MWEKERSSIEKLKLESSSHHHTEDGRRSSQSAAASSSAAAANANADRRSSVDVSRRSSLGSAFGVDHIFGRKRRHQKTKSIY